MKKPASAIKSLGADWIEETPSREHQAEVMADVVAEKEAAESVPAKPKRRGVKEPRITDGVAWPLSSPL